MVLNRAQGLKKKSHEVSARKNNNRLRYNKKCRGGGFRPPGSFRVKEERRRLESFMKAQRFNSAKRQVTNSQFLALNSWKAHTSSISCTYLVCDTDLFCPIFHCKSAIWAKSTLMTSLWHHTWYVWKLLVCMERGDQ